MIRWRTLLAPLLAAGIAGGFVPVEFWDSAKQALLVALSVIAAGVLVRLARGLPFTTPDLYEVEEIRSLTAAVAHIMRSLKALIVVVLAGMVLLVLAKPLLNSVTAVPVLTPFKAVIEVAISSALGMLLGYTFFRILQVVRGDQDLTELQSKFIVRAVERKQARRFEQQQRDGPLPFKSPEGYGRIIQ